MGRDQGQSCQVAEFDPFLSFDCAREEGTGALIISVAEPQSRSPKGQTHTIYKSGLFYLATIIREGGRAGAGRVTYCKEGEEGRQAAASAARRHPRRPRKNDVETRFP